MYVIVWVFVQAMKNRYGTFGWMGYQQRHTSLFSNQIVHEDSRKQVTEENLHKSRNPFTKIPVEIKLS